MILPHAMPRLVRGLAGCLALSLGSTVLTAVRLDAPPDRADRAPVVYAADVDSIIHPVSAEYMMETTA